MRSYYFMVSFFSFFTEEGYTVTIPREGGLGLVLGELWAAGDGSGRGLVLVEAIAEGGNAARVGGIAVGDSIVGVIGEGGLADGIDTEGKDWDVTIGAIASMKGRDLVTSDHRAHPPTHPTTTTDTPEADLKHSLPTRLLLACACLEDAEYEAPRTTGPTQCGRDGFRRDRPWHFLLRERLKLAHGVSAQRPTAGRDLRLPNHEI